MCLLKLFNFTFQSQPTFIPVSPAPSRPVPRFCKLLKFDCKNRSNPLCCTDSPHGPGQEEINYEEQQLMEKPKVTPEVNNISIKKNDVIAQDNMTDKIVKDSSQLSIERESYNPRQDKNNYSSAKTPTILVISLYSSVKSPLCEIINCAKGRNKKHKRLNNKKSINAPNPFFF